MRGRRIHGKLLKIRAIILHARGRSRSTAVGPYQARARRILPSHTALAASDAGAVDADQGCDRPLPSGRGAARPGGMVADDRRTGRTVHLPAILRPERISQAYRIELPPMRGQPAATARAD